jgi:hypothetical protein
MRRTGKILLWIWGVFWAFVLVAATIPAKQAVSNLASWVEFFGLFDLAHFVATKAADVGAVIAATISILVSVALKYLEIRSREHTRLYREDYRRVFGRDPD